MIRPTNNRILIQLTPEDYKTFTTEPNINLFKGTVHSVSEGTFSENPVATDGQGSFSWVRKPSDSNLKSGDIIMFMRDGLGVPAVVRDDNPVSDTVNGESSEGLTHLVLIEEAHIFAVVYSDATQE